ncbi:MAG: metallophosphoesterase [Anaerolineales bacterium]
MKIIAIADIHGRIGQLELAADDLANADLVVLTGDITHFGRRAEAEEMIGQIERYNNQILAVAGNCDYPQAETYLSERGFNLHASHRVIDGLTFVGLGGSLPAPAPTPNVYTEDQLAAFLNSAVEGIDPSSPMILVSHQPPKDTELDRIASGDHVGSQQVRRFIEEHKPLLCLSGHIHEAAAIDRLGSTTLVNPGPLHTGHYAAIEVNDGLQTVEIRGASR